MEVINQLNDLTLDKVVDYVDNFRFVVGLFGELVLKKGKRISV